MTNAGKSKPCNHSNLAYDVNIHSSCMEFGHNGLVDPFENFAHPAYVQCLNARSYVGGDGVTVNRA